jgi:hypothetical protein
MMPLTKLWLFLLSLLCGLAALLVVALDPELQRREVVTQSQAVARAQKISSQFLENQAHQLVQAAVQLSSDAVLQESLSQLARSQGEPAILHETAQGALRRLVTPLSLSFALVTDLRGHVLARVGQDEAVYGDPLDGLPAVEAALRGYRLDDLWLFQGALYRIAAVPLIAGAGGGGARDRYVGTLVIGRVLGSELLAQIAQLTGVQGAIVARGQLLAHSLASVGKTAVFRAHNGGVALSAESLLLARRGLAAADGVARDGDHFLAFVDLPGTASGTTVGPTATTTRPDQGALLVLSSRGGGGRVLPLVLREALRQGLAPVSLAVLLGAVLLLYVLGLGVVGSESRLLVLSQSSRQGARSGTASGRPTASDAGPSRSAPQIVDRAPVVPAPASEPPAAMPAPSPAASPPPPSAQSPRLTPPPSAQSPRMTPPPSAQSPRLTPQPLTSTRTPLPPLAMGEDTSTPLPPPIPQRSDWGPPGELISDASRALAGEYDHTDLGPSDLAETRAAALPQPSSNFEPTVVASAPNGATDPDVTFYQVFQEYVQARERCRESVEGLSYEQFRKRLADSRAAIIREHGCVSVEFHVYIKDGRAALKAIPQWAPLPPPLASPISGP